MQNYIIVNFFMKEKNNLTQTLAKPNCFNIVDTKTFCRHVKKKNGSHL